MTYQPSALDIERKLRAAESAAASAIINGATADEIRQRVEIGIAEALDMPIVKDRQAAV
jgi:hypothetical protein